MTKTPTAKRQLRFRNVRAVPIETDFGDVPKLRDDQRVVIASPVCYHGDEFLQEHRVSFLKIGRDIDAAQLKGQNPTEQIAAMEQAENAFYTPEDRA